MNVDVIKYEHIDKEKLRYLRLKVITSLIKLKCAHHFIKSENCLQMFPSCYDDIKKQINLTTIYQKLKSYVYKNSSECIRDFNLIINNCKNLNLPSSKIYKYAIKFQKHLQKKVAIILKADFKFPQIERKLNISTQFNNTSKKFKNPYTIECIEYYCLNILNKIYDKNIEYLNRFCKLSNQEQGFVQFSQFNSANKILLNLDEFRVRLNSFNKINLNSFVNEILWIVSKSILYSNKNKQTFENAYLLRMEFESEFNKIPLKLIEKNENIIKQNYEELVLIKTKIEEMPSKQLKRIIKIVIIDRSTIIIKNQGDFQIEIDFEKMSNKSISELMKYFS